MNSNDSSFSFDSGNSGFRSSVPQKKGRWHVILTAAALVTVAALSLGMAFLTRNVEERPVWMMGLIFMVPAAALMLGCMMVESATSAMTPGESRTPQTIVALSAVAATFLVGCLCDLVYLSGFKSREKIVMVVDKSYSMTGDTDKYSKKTLHGLLDQLTPADYVGAIVFSNEVLATAPLALKTESHDALLRKVVNTALKGTTDFYLPLQRVLEMVEQSDADKSMVTKVVFSTDGSPTSWGNDTSRSTAQKVQDIISACKRDNIQISGVQINSRMCSELRQIIQETGGQVYEVSNAEEFLQGVTNAASLKDKDLMRSDTMAAKVITFVMLLLEGLSLGVCLSLMLSRRGQFRFQYILSPLLGILAFAVLKLVFPGLIQEPADWWIAEGLSLSLLGLVFMRRNDSPAPKNKPGSAGQPAQNTDMFGF